MMSSVDVVLAWKNANYRSSLSYEELALLPGNPAGSIELPDELQNFVDDDLSLFSLSASCHTYACMALSNDDISVNSDLYAMA